MVETRTALIHLADFGIVIARIKKDILQSLDDAARNLSAAVEVAAGQRRPLLIDIRAALPLDDDVRRRYSGSRVVDHFSALGLVVDDGPFGRMMGNLYFRVADLTIATRLFAGEGEAVAWLLEYRTPQPER
ncbi:MAG: hypothetical protein IT176_11160 [Acidobacteria bacterium]|nr:hypothetical protein [Acidobacteriota bacterium]